MTRERAFELGTEAAAWHPDLNAARRIAKAILTAVAEENEACAKIAEAIGEDSIVTSSCDGFCGSHYSEKISDEIRTRRGQ